MTLWSRAADRDICSAHSSTSSCHWSGCWWCPAAGFDSVAGHCTCTKHADICLQQKMTDYQYIACVHIIKDCNQNLFLHNTSLCKVIQKLWKRCMTALQRFCLILKHLKYSERHRVCKLPSLHYRRITGIMIETFKILTKKYDMRATPTMLGVSSY